MVTNPQSSDMENINNALRCKILAQIEFLAGQWSGARERKDLQQSNDLANAYAGVAELAEMFGIRLPSINETNIPPHKHYAYPKTGSFLAVGESLLGELAAHWRAAKGNQNENQAKEAVNLYNKVFKFLWSKGFRGDMFPECELPEDLMPDYFVDYWRSKGSL